MTTQEARRRLDAAREALLKARADGNREAEHAAIQRADAALDVWLAVAQSPEEVSV
jgi:hypothetical protein